MKRQLIWLCAIVAVPIFVLAGARPIAVSVSEPVTGPIPNPAEVELLEELASWADEEVDRPVSGLRALDSPDSSGRRSMLAELPYARLISEAAVRHGVDPLLLAAMIETESRFDPDAESGKGALGLMQVMPFVGESYGALDLRDPHQNLDAGARHFATMLGRFDADLVLALAAYNAGPGNVHRYGGVPPFPETTRYVDVVVERYLDHLREVWKRNGRTLPAPPSSTDEIVLGAALAAGG